MQTVRDLIKYNNDNGIFYLKLAIYSAWQEVKNTGKEIVLNNIPVSLLEDVLEDNRVDLSTSFVNEDSQFIEYNTDWIHFILEKDTGWLTITKKK